MSRLLDGMRWFKSQFADAINPQIDDTPYSLDLMTALATQETFEIWGNVFTTLPADRILEICVGDTIGAPNRKAFPTTKQNLLSDPNGAALFKIARAALEDMGNHIAIYHKVAQANPDKFCHGFGIFQYDIKFARHGHDPAYFLNKEWYDFDKCLAKALSELESAQSRAGLGGRQVLSNLEMAHVAIAYNSGSFNPARGLKQGFKDGSGKYYGELIDSYIGLAEGV